LQDPLPGKEACEACFSDQELSVNHKRIFYKETSKSRQENGRATAPYPRAERESKEDIKGMKGMKKG